jgi:hypothetical protein
MEGRAGGGRPVHTRAGYVSAAAVLCLLAACEDEEPPRNRAEAPSRPPRPALLAPRELATDASFAITPLDDGVLLVWGAPPVPSPGVRASLLSPLGEPRAHDQVLSEDLPIELDAVADGARAAVAWVAQPSAAGRELRVVAALGVGGHFGPAADFGPAEPLRSAGRGRLALASGPDGVFSLSHRVPPAPCASRDGMCARVRRDRVDTGASVRGDDPLEVPGPCDPLVVGSVRAEGTWFSALCHEERGPTGALAPRATVYAIRPSIALAAASQVLVGCAPRALAPTAGGAALVAECPEGRSVAWQDELGRPLGEIRGARFEIACVGRPLLRISGEAGALEVPLTVAVGRIEGLLPSTVAADHARAVWSGAAILVATPRRSGERRELVLDRYACEDGRLERTSP